MGAMGTEAPVLQIPFYSPRPKIYMSLLIKNCLLIDRKVDVYIEGNRIKKISPDISERAEKTIKADGKAVVPSYANTHTHAAMTLMRGYADDMPLHKWLEDHIWPVEAKLTDEDIYWGAKLACLEMIKSGTTFFNDMYFHPRHVTRAAMEAGIRVCTGPVFLDLFNAERREEEIKRNERQIDEMLKVSDGTVKAAICPHSVYTVSKAGLEWCRDVAKEHNMVLHIHLSETEKENADSVKINGLRPAPYIKKIGLLSPKTVAAHCVWLDEGEIKELARLGVNVSYNPVSNMKLSVGSALKYMQMKAAGINVTLGTDGCASNNNLDMHESMKVAALLQKFHTNDITIMPAAEAFDMATINGMKAFGINAGLVEEGMLADLLLVNLKKANMTPNHNLLSNLVYSASDSCIDTTICNGKVLMENRVVEGEEEILTKAAKVAEQLVRKAKM